LPSKVIELWKKQNMISLDGYSSTSRD